MLNRCSLRHLRALKGLVPRIPVRSIRLPCLRRSVRPCPRPHPTLKRTAVLVWKHATRLVRFDSCAVPPGFVLVTPVYKCCRSTFSLTSVSSDCSDWSFV